MRQRCFSLSEHHSGFLRYDEENNRVYVFLFIQTQHSLILILMDTIIGTSLTIHSWLSLIPTTNGPVSSTGTVWMLLHLVSGDSRSWKAKIVLIRRLQKMRFILLVETSFLFKGRVSAQWESLLAEVSLLRATTRFLPIRPPPQFPPLRYDWEDDTAGLVLLLSCPDINTDTTTSSTTHSWHSYW